MPSQVKGAALRRLSRRGSWVQIPPPAPIYQKIMGSNVTRSVITESDGIFSIKFRPNQFGKWLVRVYWDGNKTHAPYSTDGYYFTVHERKFPIVEVAVGGVVAVVVLVVALKFIRRRGRS